MKKIFFIFALIAVFASGLHAQNQHYHRVGDTIRGRDTIYFYQWWSEQWLSDSSNFLYYDIYYCNSYAGFPYSVPWIPNGFCSSKTLGRYVRYNYTEQPLKIAGLAACIAVMLGDSDIYPIPPDTLEPTYPEYLLLYDARSDTFPLLASVQFHHAEPVRYMEVPLRGNNYLGGDFFPGQLCCEEQYDVNRYLPVHEYYFDKPVTVYDSFYVGMTSNNILAANIPLEYIYPECIVSAYTIGYASSTSLCPATYTDTCYSAPLQLYKYKTFKYEEGQGQLISDTNWIWHEDPFFSLIFPIIQIDSFPAPPQYECPEVENFRVGNEGDGSVVLLWHNHNDHLRWEVSYGPQGIAPEDGTQLIAAIPAIQIANLDSCTHYTAYIRAVCMHDSLHYSEWSEPLDICLCDTGGAAAIEVPLLERLTYLMPNPAADQVQVLSSYGMTRVEAYSLQGTKMADLRVRGLGATLDVADWPQGMYIVVVHTPAGNVTKKLVVGR
jgi:hypothetical protein